MIPKIIWIFWKQGYDAAPLLVKQCIDSWKKHNPDYEVNILDEKTLFNYIILPAGLDFNRDDIPTQKVAAISRLLLLQRYGGVWVDATVYCCKSIDTWLPEYMTTGFFAFRNPGPDRMMSNWMIAARSDNTILNKLTTDFIDLYIKYRFTNLNTPFGKKIVRYLTPILSTSHKRSLWWVSPFVVRALKVYPYFLFHYTFNKVILKNKKCQEEWNSAKKFEADAPHRLQHFAAENDVNSALQFMEQDSSPVYKLDWRVDVKQGYWNTILEHLTKH